MIFFVNLTIMFKIFKNIAQIKLLLCYGVSLCASDVSINLMWINDKYEYKNYKIPNTNYVIPIPSNDYIMPFAQLEQFEKSLKGWSDKQPSTKINVWYDSNALIELSVLNTKEKIQSIVKHPKNIKLRDIRTLEDVYEHSDLFENPINIYYRVDLLRFIIAKNLLCAKECEFFIYSDLNVQPENQKYIFNKQTNKFLDEVGFVMLRNDMGPNSHPQGGSDGFENKFMICKNNPHFLNAVEKVLIYPNFLLKQKIDSYPKNYHDAMCYNMGGQIYVGIIYMFIYMMHTQNKIKLYYLEKDYKEERDYNPNTMYDLTSLRYNLNFFTIWMEGFSFTSNQNSTNRLKKFMFENDFANRYKNRHKSLRSMQEYHDIITSITISLCNGANMDDCMIPTIRMTAPRSHLNNGGAAIFMQ